MTLSDHAGVPAADARRVGLPTGARALTVAALVAVSVVPLAGCTTTQEKSATLSRNAKQAAQAKQFSVGRTNPDIKIERVTRLSGADAAAVVVKVDNRTKITQAAVPIGVDLYDAKDRSLYSNRIDGLDPALNHLPVVPPGMSYWVNNQVPAAKAKRTRVRIGQAKVTLPSKLPVLKLTKVKLGDDGGVATAKGVVRNLSSVDQLKLTIFAVATKGDKVVAAGRSVVERVGAKGSPGQRFAIYFTGDPRGAKLQLFVPPSTHGTA